MAKTKGKAKVAASNVPSKVEADAGNEMLAESAPSESVEIKEAAMTMVFDKPGEVATKEETEDGPDDSEAVHEKEDIKGGPDVSVTVDDKEETKNDLEVSEEEDEKEETEDGPVESEEDEAEEGEDEIDEYEEVDEIEESEEGLGKSEDGVRREETKDGPDKPEEGHKEDTKEEGKVEPMGTNVPEGEKVEEGAVAEEAKEQGKVENTPGKKAKRIRKRKKKAAASAGASNGADKSNDGNKQRSSAAVKKDLKMADGMGLIFMCNAKTKMDCFRYKVFGLPASKKELVAKVYKGMRLFLFDIDLKLLYGIYKAASPGGYNIEPKAFKSAFPSQVRFNVLKDCLPLPEERFKAAIKENYYGKNKFDCQLSPEQVKDLCKLFQSAGGMSSKKRSREVVREETEQISSARGQKRSRQGRTRREDSIPRGRKSYGRREEARRSPPPRSRDFTRAEPERISTARGRKRSRREGGRRDDSIPRGGRDSYARREVYRSPPPRSLAVAPPPLSHVPYAYGRSGDDYYYRREAPLLDPRDHRIVDLEARPREPLGYQDPYSVYREPLPREALYREPLPREAVYREPVPVPYHEALYPAAPPTLYYRY